MFLDRLSSVSEKIEGARALSLVAPDGIPVESFSADNTLDLDALAAELISQVRGIAQDNRDLEVGTVEQLSVSTDRMVLMVSALSAGYYLLLVLDHGSSHGRARFELRRARLLFEGEFE